MKKSTLLFGIISMFCCGKIFSQTCNNVLTVTVSNVVNSSSCTPCNGQATGNSSGATGYLWSNGQTTATATGLCAGTYTVYAYDASLNCGSKTVTITCPGSGVFDFTDAASLNVFPNPASDLISFELASTMHGNFSLSVMNVLGETIHQENIFVNGNLKKWIDVSDFKQGVYFLELKNEKNILVGKFLKQ